MESKEELTVADLIYKLRDFNENRGESLNKVVLFDDGSGDILDCNDIPIRSFDSLTEMERLLESFV